MISEIYVLIAESGILFLYNIDRVLDSHKFAIVFINDLFSPECLGLLLVVVLLNSQFSQVDLVLDLFLNVKGQAIALSYFL
jgi:hypothetical protein